MTTEETHPDPAIRVCLEITAAERERGERYLARALDAEREVRELRRMLGHLVGEYVIETAGGSAYVHPDVRVNDYRHQLWMDARALAKVGEA